MKIILYDIPPSQNKYQNLHHMKKHSIKKRWERDIYYASYNQRPPEPCTSAKVTIIIYFETIRKRDKDNYTFKPILDGLKYAKIIADDNDSVIGQPEIRFEQGKQRTEIIVEED